MARTDNLTNYLTDVADAIREKKGTTDVIPANTFDEEIKNLPSGGGDVSEYFETTVTKSTSSGFMSRRYIKKGPDLVLDEDVTSLEYFASNFGYPFLPFFDTKNVTDFSNFMGNSSYVTIMPPYDTSKAIFVGAFLNAAGLVECPLFDFGKVSSLGSNGIFGYANPSKLTTLGGFKDLGKAYSTTQSANYSSYKLDLSKATNLTHESLMNVINNLYDIATAGVQAQQLVLGSDNLAKITDEEKAIAQNKGWSLS